MGQDFVQVDTLKVAPEKLSSLVTGEILEVLSIDFNGDGKKDFISLSRTDEDYVFEENWVTSNYNIVVTRVIYSVPINYTRYVNLDADPELEVFEASGYEDGIDYVFHDLNFNKKTLDVLFYFNPIIVDNNNQFWGYPWDISNVTIRTRNGKIEIMSSLDHDIIRMGQITEPEEQLILPCVFFSGIPTQSGTMNNIRNIKWYSIEEIINSIIIK